MAEDYTRDLTPESQARPLPGKVPKEVLTVFFYRISDNPVYLTYIQAGSITDRCMNITQRLLNIYLNDKNMVPRSAYRKAIGDGIRTITYGAHTSLAANGKSSSFVTNVTSAELHQEAMMLCHELGKLMTAFVPYLSITIVVLSTGEELGPHRNIQNNRHCRNATISFGQWTGGYCNCGMESSGKTGILVITGWYWMHEAPRTGFHKLMEKGCR